MGNYHIRNFNRGMCDSASRARGNETSGDSATPQGTRKVRSSGKTPGVKTFGAVMYEEWKFVTMFGELEIQKVFLRF